MDERNYFVYIHEFPNGKVYIGQTRKSPDTRWYSDGSGYKGQIVWDAIKKYGWDNILHDILACSLTMEEACDEEKYWIAYYDSTNREYGYNIQSGGMVAYERSDSDEIRQKMSERMTSENNPFYGKQHSSLSKLKISNKNKGKFLGGKRRSAKGFAWQYTDEPHPYVNPKPLKKVVQLDKETDEFISVYDSVFDVEEKTGISHKGVSRCCGGFGNSYKGYKWMWLDNYGGDTYA